MILLCRRRSGWDCASNNKIGEVISNNKIRDNNLTIHNKLIHYFGIKDLINYHDARRLPQ